MGGSNQGRSQNSRSLHSRGTKEPLVEGGNDMMIYSNNQNKGHPNMRPSSAIRHQQHQQQLKLKSQHASNIKIKGGQGSKHNHNQSVAVVSQSAAYSKINIGSIENLNPKGKMQMHQKHQSMNQRATGGGNVSNGQMTSNSMLNTSGNNLTQSPSTVMRNKKALFRMVKK